MIETTGIVTALDGLHVLVQTEQHGCGRCHEDGGCGGNTIGNMLCSTPKAFWLQNPGNLRAGDRVTIVIPEGAIRQTAMRAYLIPLLALLAGAFVGYGIAGETGAMIGSLASLSLAWISLRSMQFRCPQPYIKR